MSEIRVVSGVPVTANFAGIGAPTPCAPVIVDTASGILYTLKTGDVIVPAGSSGTVTSVSFTGGLITVGTASSTPALTVAGTSGGIPYFSGAATWASSGVLAANAIVVGGGAGVSPATTTTGTGVLTALGVSVGSAGAFVTFNGALGTPSSGVATNLTGTASGLTAGTVTTNANLTGPITSSGNATSIASQTGTGTKFVVDTSPTLVTPKSSTTIGVGNATASASGAGISYPATQSASTDVNTLDDYDEYTSASTACTGAITASVAWRLVKVGNAITLYMPAVAGSLANSQTSFTYGLALPSKYRPSGNMNIISIPIVVSGADVATPGVLRIVASTGVMSMFRDGTLGVNWAGVCGTGYDTSVAWTL